MNENPPPPQQKGIGCFAKGCLSFFGLIVFLAIALIGGTFFGLQYLLGKYSATAPMPLPTPVPEVEMAASEPVPAPMAATVTPTPTPVPLETRWKNFEKADERHIEGNIQLSAGEINALLGANKKTSGKAYVAIDNNRAHVTVSIPLQHVLFMNGRYLNGDATIVPSSDGSPQGAQITNITLNHHQVPDSIIDQRLFGSKSIRYYINDWLSHEQVTSFRIENNRVIGQKSGGGNF